LSWSMTASSPVLAAARTAAEGSASRSTKYGTAC
jgi:hypothetical protein